MSWKSACSRLLQKYAPRAYLAAEIARHNPHFEPEYWLLPRLCRRGAASVDVGGNAGYYAYYLSRLTRQVHVFEPNPICLAQLRRIQRRNMILRDVALSDHSGTAVMRFDPGNTGIGTIEAANRLDKNPGIKTIVEREVKICPLDDLSLRDVAFMKIDVEGHEPAVLRGAVRLIANLKPVLLIEIERRHNPAAFEEVEDLLARFGYSVWQLSAGSLIPVRREEIDQLQASPLGPHYANNFIFIPPERVDLLHSLPRAPRS
jgi:FkbM family methyltransferase